MKLQYCLTGLLCLFLNTNAQIKPLSIGDSVPAVPVKNICNYPASQSNLAAFKNKLLILDFMATNCASCIKALPAMDALQKKYPDDIQVLLITGQPAEKIKPFLQKHSGLTLPIAAGDTVLSEMFPHTFISHVVWINEGVVKAITHPEYVTANNIATLVATNEISLPVKNDLETCKKYSIINLYLYSYGLSQYASQSIILEVKDSSRLVYNKTDGFKDKWKQANTFCLSSVFPPSITKQNMRSYLDSSFSLHGRIEQRKVMAYMLVPAGGVFHVNVTSSSVIGSTISVTNLIYMLNQKFYSTPYIDSSQTPKRMLTISKDFLDNPEQLQAELKTQGLQLVQREMEMEVLVITDNKFSKTK